MKRITLLLTLLASVMIAQVPNTMSFQGILTNPDGSAYDDGDYELTFRLIKILDDGNEQVIWEEAHTANISGGVFAVILGSINAVPDNVPGDALLETQVGEEVLSPRQPLTSVPFAFRSNRSQFSNHSAIADTAIFAHESHHSVMAATVFG